MERPGLAVFVFDADNILEVYRSIADAEQSFEAVDVLNGEFPLSYLADGRVLEIRAHLDNAKISETTTFDRAGLIQRLKLAHSRYPANEEDPELYAENFLSHDEEC